MTSDPDAITLLAAAEDEARRLGYKRLYNATDEDTDLLKARGTKRTDT